MQKVAGCKTTCLARVEARAAKGWWWECWNAGGSSRRKNNGREQTRLALERMNNYNGQRAWWKMVQTKELEFEAVESASKGSSDGLVKLMGRAGMGASFSFSQLRPPPLVS
jgi:hypothetical protein